MVMHKATKLQRAMKIINKSQISQNEESQMFDELLILKSIDHPNIVKVLDYFQDDQCHYLVSQQKKKFLIINMIQFILTNRICTGGELFERIQDLSPFSQKTAAHYMKQILSAIFYCHLNKIVHRDLQPENILFESKSPNAVIKIIDFGASAKFSESGQLTKRIGTPFYVAPEILSKNSYDEQCDIWSLGVILYILLCGYPPFYGEEDEQIYASVKQGKFQFYGEKNKEIFSFNFNIFLDQDWDIISSEAKDLIVKMLTVDPAKRITATQAYAHPWIQNNAFVNVLNDKMMKKLNGFNAQNQLKNAIMQLMASHLSTQQQKDQIIQFFQSLDQNGDGSLSSEELLKGYEEILKDPAQAKQTVDEILPKLDVDGSGKIYAKQDLLNLSLEFLTAAFNRQKFLTEEQIIRAFKLLDLDGNGQITKQELEEMLGNIQMDDGTWHDLLKDVDQNGDGMISLDEFIQMFISQIETIKPQNMQI